MRRLEEERLREARARRTKRLRMLVGVVVAATAVVTAAIAISSSGGTSGLKHGAAASAVVRDVDRLLAGVPQSGTRLGSATAPVTLYYYGDLECPVCAMFTAKSLPQLIANDVRGGRVQLVYRAMQTASRDPRVFAAQQIAALAAGTQHRFWQFVELFYREQGVEGSGYVTEAYLDQIARQVTGLDYSRWLKDRQAPALSAQLRAETAAGLTDRVQGTPTLVAQGSRGRMTIPSAVPSYSQLQQTITAAG